MQKSLAIDGTEWQAADMTFMQDGYINAILRRTKRLLGTSGVVTGGVVTSAGGLNIAISGPLEFAVNGEYGIINAPANQALANNNTNYIVAKYSETDDTPALFYGAGVTPLIHRNETPTIISRTTSPAVESAGEVDLATVTTSGGAITLITDTRIITPSVSNGNISLGPLKTIDGVDPSVHVTTVATNAVLGHVLLGAPGGAARYEDLPAATKYYIVDLYIAGRGNGFIPNDSDFTSPPIGRTVKTFRYTTYDGSFWREGSGASWNLRATLNFNSTTAFNKTANVLTVDDSVRVKLNGSDVYSNGSAVDDLDRALTLPIVQGSNVLKLFMSNNGGGAWRINFLTDLLRDSRITFTPL